MDNPTLIIASLSRPELNLWVNGSIATMIAGSLFFLFGAIIGWWMWRHARSQTQVVTVDNQKLVKSYKQRNSKFNRLAEQLNTYSNRVN